MWRRYVWRPTLRTPDSELATTRHFRGYGVSVSNGRGKDVGMPTALRRSRYDQPGIRRRRVGSGFAYYYDDGRRVTEVDVLARVKSLVIPPAWTDVWICPWPNGHVQALGTDAAGRRQYRYHDDWRLMRDAEKHERVLRMAAALPAMREQVAADLATEGLGRLRVLAAAVRLLDLGFFRVGGETYADEHNTYGLATLRKNHVTLEPGGLVFEYDAKGGKHRVVTIIDPDVREVIAALKRRRGGGEELLAYKNSAGRWCDVRSTDVNGHLREIDRRRHDGEGFPHLARHRVDGGRPCRLRCDTDGTDRARAGSRACVSRSRRLPRQHASGLPEVVCRSARGRAVRARRHHRGRPRQAWCRRVIRTRDPWCDRTVSGAPVVGSARASPRRTSGSYTWCDKPERATLRAARPTDRGCAGSRRPVRNAAREPRIRTTRGAATTPAW